MAKYKVGDKVRVRSDLVVDEDYGEEYFVEEMNQYKGKNVTIASVLENTYFKKYFILEDSEECVWTDEMFDGLAEEENHISAEEVINWLSENYNDSDKCEDVFGINLAISKWDEYGVKNVLSKIEEDIKNKEEEKEIETEFRYVFRIIEDTKDKKVCVEEKIKNYSRLLFGEEETIASDYLKEYCKTHEGNFFCAIERNCYVKNNKEQGSK